MTDRLVELEIEGRDKQLNPSNIAYIISRFDEIRFRGYVTLILAFVLTIIAPMLVTSNPLVIGVFGIIGVIITYLLFRRMRGEDLQVVGTVNDSYDVSIQNMNRIRSAFEDSESDSVYIGGEQNTIFSSMDYSYYITPQNVVSVDHIDRSIPKIMSVGFIIVSLALIVFTTYSYTGIERISGVSIGLTLLAVTTIFTISNRPDFIEIEFTNDETKRIPLSKEKSKELIKYLRGEKSLSELSSGMEKPPIGDDYNNLKEIESEDVKELESN